MAEGMRLSEIPEEGIRLSEVPEEKRLRLSDVSGDERPILDRIKDIYWAPTEAVLQFGSGVASLIPSGLAGIGAGAMGGDAPGAVEGVREGMTYGVGWGREPTPEVEAVSGGINWHFEKWREYVADPVGEFFNKPGDSLQSPSRGRPHP